MNQMEITVLESQSIFFRFLHTRLHKAAIDFTLFLASFTFYDYFQVPGSSSPTPKNILCFEQFAVAAPGLVLRPTIVLCYKQQPQSFFSLPYNL